MNIEQNIIFEGKAKRKAVLEIIIIFSLAIVVYIFASYLDILEIIIEFLQKYEYLELDELITVSFFLVVAMLFFAIRRWQDVESINSMIVKKNKELVKAFSEIQRLKGIIPICAACKKIRDDRGFWHRVEAYISSHTEAEFSHSVCPECMTKLYPDFVGDE